MVCKIRYGSYPHGICNQVRQIGTSQVVSYIWERERDWDWKREIKIEIAVFCVSICHPSVSIYLSKERKRERTTTGTVAPHLRPGRRGGNGFCEEGCLNCDLKSQSGWTREGKTRERPYVMIDRAVNVKEARFARHKVGSGDEADLLGQPLPALAARPEILTVSWRWQMTTALPESRRRLDHPCRFLWKSKCDHHSKGGNTCLPPKPPKHFYSQSA